MKQVQLHLIVPADPGALNSKPSVCRHALPPTANLLQIIKSGENVAFDPQDETSEISIEKLFSKFERQLDPVLDGKIELFPLHDRLTPDNFERLIARLADPADGMSVRASRYGKSGSTQGGIDVMVIDSTAHKCDYYEGKRWAHIACGVRSVRRSTHDGDLPRSAWTFERASQSAWQTAFIGCPLATRASAQSTFFRRRTPPLP